MYGFCRMSQCVGRMGRQVADDTCEFLSRVCCFFIFLCASRVDAVCIHSQLDGLAAFQRRDHLTWVKCPTWPNQWSNQLTQKSGYRAISLAPIFVWIVLRNFKSFSCLKVIFFWGGGPLAYCWWFRNPANQLDMVIIPLFAGYLYIPGGCLGCLASTIMNLHHTGIPRLLTVVAGALLVDAGVHSCCFKTCGLPGIKTNMFLVENVHLRKNLKSWSISRRFKKRESQRYTRIIGNDKRRSIQMLQKSG